MRIYVAHPTGMDYENEIYRPLRENEILRRHELVLPHEKAQEIANAREDYRGFDLVIAECSQPSMGVGIELGWFYDDRVPIVALVKRGFVASEALKIVATEILEYDAGDLSRKVEKIVQEKE